MWTLCNCDVVIALWKMVYLILLRCFFLLWFLFHSVNNWLVIIDNGWQHVCDRQTICWHINTHAHTTRSSSHYMNTHTHTQGAILRFTLQPLGSKTRSYTSFNPVRTKDTLSQTCSSSSEWQILVFIHALCFLLYTVYAINIPALDCCWPFLSLLLAVAPGFHLTRRVRIGNIHISISYGSTSLKKSATMRIIYINCQKYGFLVYIRWMVWLYMKIPYWSADPWVVLANQHSAFRILLPPVVRAHIAKPKSQHEYQ